MTKSTGKNTGKAKENGCRMAPVFSGLFVLMASCVPQAFAIIGPSLSADQLPTQVCVIKYRHNRQDKQFSGVCSAVLVSARKLLTAGHCIYEKSAVAVETECPGGRKAKITGGKIHSGFKDTWKITDDRERRFDLGVYSIDRDLGLRPMPVVESLQAAQKLARTSRLCAVFGYGGRRINADNAFSLQSGWVYPKGIRFKGGIIWLNALEKRLASVVVPGDSGGSLACQDQQKQWVHVAQISGVGMQYDSVLAPAHLAAELIQPLVRTKITKMQRLSESVVRVKQYTRALQVKIKRKKLPAFYGAVLSKVSKTQIRLLVNGRASSQTALAALRYFASRLDAVAAQKVRSGGTYWLDAYSDVFKLPGFHISRGRMVDASTYAYDQERFARYQALSIADIDVSQFAVRRVDGEFAYGDLSVPFVTSQYKCHNMAICRQQTLHNVKVSIHRLRAL